MRHLGASFELELTDNTLTERDKAFIRHFFVDPQNPVYTRNLFAGLTLDNLSEEPVFFRVMLAGLGHDRGWDGFPEEFLPRFKGIYDHFSTDNEMKFTWLCSILRPLADSGIPVMLIKGAAMYAFYRRGMPRIMDDYDVAVPEADFARAAELLREAGFGYAGTAPWSETFTASVNGKQTKIDLHKHIFKNAETADRHVWENALQTEAGGIKIMVPAPADMCLHLLDTEMRNYLYNEHPERRVKWIADWCMLRDRYEDAFSPEKLRDLSVRFFDTCHVRLAMRVLSAVFPELMAPETVARCFPDDEGYAEWLDRAAVFRARLMTVTALPDKKSLTPHHLYLAARRWFSEYRLMGPELQAQYGKITFLDYFYRKTGSGNFTGALKQYVPRLRLFGRTGRKDVIYHEGD